MRKFFTILAFSSFDEPDKYKHFSLILDVTTHKFIDSWDGKIKYWARDNFGGGIPGAEYRVCPLQTYRKYRGMNYVKE